MRPSDLPVPGARPRRLRIPAALAALALLAAPARAQTVTPWVPPGDSLRAWALEARARFQSNTGDTVGGENYRAYERVGLMARRLLRSLGPANMLQAPAIGPVLDSLGLETSVTIDPAHPAFALVMVRNPFRWTARAVGFLFWSKGDDFRIQGAEFRGGVDPAMRAWWTGKPDRPYEWAVIERERGGGPVRFTLFRLSPGGGFWNLAQDSDRSSIMGAPGEAVFTDINHDGVPEVVHWTLANTDSLFLPCSDCPRLTTEDTYVERQEGFVLEDSRLLPSGYAAFVLFVRLLLDKDRVAAGRLLRTPGDVTKAVAEGWSVTRKPGAWRIEYAEPGEAWPRWIEARFDGPQGARRYLIRFGERAGRWIIENWVEPKSAAPRPGAGR
jgi:hypothetical protein